ncbi:hypothetical protein KAI87_11190, partial [Myxococcota bacterium]|nr:hypothetical protein [Myxococcota bacterium]
MSIQAPSPDPSPTNVEDALRRAKNEYAYGEFELAAEHLHNLLYPMMRLHTDDDVIEARKYLALSYYLLDRVEEMGEEFAKLLLLEPDYKLDPFTVAPPVIEEFEIVRTLLKPELDRIREEKLQKRMQEPKRAGYRQIVETTITERSEF